MSSIPIRIQKWIERDNARIAASSTRWLIARALFGLAFVAKGTAVFIHAADGWHYALGPMLIIGGLAFIIESAQTPARRPKHRRSTTVGRE